MHFLLPTLQSSNYSHKTKPQMTLHFSHCTDIIINLNENAPKRNTQSNGSKIPKERKKLHNRIKKLKRKKHIAHSKERKRRLEKQILETEQKIIESKRITTENLNYQKVIYTGEQGMFNLKFEQYYWIVGDKAFILTLTCEESQFDNFQVKGEKVLNSFNINQN